MTARAFRLTALFVSAPEVGKFGAECLEKQDVGRFQILVSDSLTMQLLERGRNVV